MEIIATHISSDFDAFAALVAAKKIYPEAKAILPTSINQNVRKFIALHEEELLTLHEISDIDLKKVNRIIIVDTRIASRIGQAAQVLSNPGVKVIIYDHHQKTGQDIRGDFDYSQNIGSTTSILVEILKKKNIPITSLEATLLALGIYEDTGSFTYPSTTFQDMQAAAYLLEKGANIYVLNQFHNISLTEDQHYLLEVLIDNIEKIKIKEKEILLSWAKVDDYVEGLSVLTRKLSQIEDINTVICWAQMKGKVYIVGRSYDRSIDVSDILSFLGGGGHPQAASAVMEADQFGLIKDKIVGALSQQIKSPVRARDVMSYPVKYVNEDQTIAEVDKILKKYGHSGIPILDSNLKLAGIITRKDIDKAINHNLSHAPVKGFRSHSVVTASPSDTVESIQDLMIDNGIGRIPIVEKDKMVGIITRKDILRYLHGRGFDQKVKILEDSITRLSHHFPPRIQNILNAISAESRQLGYKAYLVGGIVRDILLDIPNLDIDIVVEGDGIELASRLQQKVGGKVESYQKFKTAVLVLEPGLHIDIATARVEYYTSPAALPSVESGSIRQDLSRRDFTINAMAISLEQDNFGTLLDFFGGRKDLEQKKVKVLHKMSFIEDPTRIFRAVRFEQRLGFKIDPQTEKLILTTIDMEMVSLLGGVRIRDELVAILQEKNPYKPIKRLYQLGALAKIGLKLSVDHDFSQDIKEVLNWSEKLKPYIGPAIKRWRLLFIMLLKHESLPVVRQWCLDMKVKKKDIQVITDTLTDWKQAIDLLAEPVSQNSLLYRIAKKYSSELLVICCSWGKVYQNNVIKYLSQLQNIKLEIDGTALTGLGHTPSPVFRLVLDKLLALKLDGFIHNRKEELSYAKKLFNIHSHKGRT
ncbi:MAG: CBS domain-containing protein [Actinomycetota bacterium]|nr:CBS domain-containing protein [Actinomycetota bacterium]